MPRAQHHRNIFVSCERRVPEYTSSRVCGMALSPEAQLEKFMARYTPEIVSLAQALLDKMRARYPGAVQMVYDNFYALVVGFGPNERASEAVFSIAMYPKWVNLFFLWGA